MASVIKRDMPEGNDECDSYREFMRHIRRGRSVGIVAVVHPDGKKGTYIHSGRSGKEFEENPDVLYEDNKEAFVHASQVVAQAYVAAVAKGCTIRTKIERTDDARD